MKINPGEEEADLGPPRSVQPPVEPQPSERQRLEPPARFRVSAAHAREAPVTAALVSAAIAVTIATTLGVDMGIFLFDARGVRGEPWRILTSVLPHVGILHILFNALWTWRLGLAMERRIGSLRTLAVYVWLGLVASLAEYTFSSVGVGLSGIVYGQVALLWWLERRDPSRGVSVTNRTMRLFAIWFVVCVGLTVADILPIGNWAHGAGAAAGFSLGWILPNVTRRRAGLVLLAAATVGLFGLARWGRPTLAFVENAYLVEELAGIALLEDETPEEALPYLERAVALAPGAADAHYNLGVALQRLERHDDAADAWARVLEIDPEHEQARGALRLD